MSMTGEENIHKSTSIIRHTTQHQVAYSTRSMLFKEKKDVKHWPFGSTEDRMRSDGNRKRGHHDKYTG